MLRTSTQIRYFKAQREEGPNPYTGIMSFQHFRGEKLYSDIIVRPENNMTETENVECYPVPDDVPQNGREEGYYPDSSIVYIRILWKEFEPKRGVYNYDFIQEIIDQAKAHGQTLIFRLMAHSTRACDDVPDWLKEIIPCPERPDGMRVKDSPTAPEFVEYFCEAVKKIGERFDEDPTFDAIDISLPGSWGEGHNLHLYSQESLKKLVDTYISVFRKTRLIGQCSRPELLHYANQFVAVGWRGDGLGEPTHTFERYPKRIAMVQDLWKTGPVSFEAYWWLGEWMRKGWDIDKVIQATLDWHISSFNPKSIPIPYEWQEKVDDWVSKMGYHFAVDYFKYPEAAASGDELELELGVDNVGVAPIYNHIPVRLRLTGEKASYDFETSLDIRNWFPGKTREAFTIQLPETIEAGVYGIELGIFREDMSGLYENCQGIYLCTDATRKGCYYQVGEVTIE